MALNRVAKTSSLQALSLFNRIEDNMLANDKKVFYGRLALYAAQRHEPEALDWFKLATDNVDFNTVKSSALKYSTPNNTFLDKEQLAWYARAALRDKNWLVVADVISKMDTSQSQEGAWRYWKARALKVQKKTLEANTLFAKLSTERHFYGWLAQDELEGFITAPLVTHKTTEEAVQAFSDIPAIQRAVALQRLDFKWEAKAEWVFASKAFNDSQLLAAAEFAHRKNWHDLAIVTADKTSEIHDFALRYPTPYRIAMKSAASEQAIDEAWVYGITRQESRFMHYAKSGMGASGLMQLMPATAKWIAGKAGIEDYHHGMIYEFDTNIDIGTYYLRYTLDLMNGQAVMATAAYNAGASRAKKWMADEPLEGAIYAETIPFSETRNYVQKVMANAHIYAHQLGLKSITLKQRLGIIPGKAVAIIPAIIPAINSDNIDLKSAILINDEQ
jgi:soluble lytic murein transglycosylase